MLLEDPEGFEWGDLAVIPSASSSLARDDEDVRLLISIPGVGYYLALLIKAEIGNVSRFNSGDYLCS